TLVAPANNATGVISPVEFKWTQVNGAIGYRLFVNDDEARFTTDTSLTRLVPDGRVTWHVDAVFAGCPDVHSAQFTFTSGSSSTCGGSTNITSPAAGVTVNSPVTITWTPIAGATDYRLWAAMDGGSQTIVAHT